MNLWGLLANHNLLLWKGKIKHLLWTLFFMKVYQTEPPSCSALGGSCGEIDPKTMQKWVWRFIQQVAKLRPVVVCVIAMTLLLFLSLFRICLILLSSCHYKIDFDSRKNNDSWNDCLMSIHGTDFRIQQQGAVAKGNDFASFKLNGKSALRYKIGIDILEGNLIWIRGLYAAGK